MSPAVAWSAFRMRSRPCLTFVLSAATALLFTFVALNKVLSPQYILWLIAMIACGRSLGVAFPRVLLPGLMFAAALCQILSPFNYPELLRGTSSRPCSSCWGKLSSRDCASWPYAAGRCSDRLDSSRESAEDGRSCPDQTSYRSAAQ